MRAKPEICVAFHASVGSFLLDAAFTVPAEGVTALCGPSGCGKTTVLRCIAGLHRAGGVCEIAGDVWQDEARFLPTYRRPIGYVFQEASLFAHLSVERNLRYGTQAAGGIGFGEVIEVLGLHHLLTRSPRNLSGGERQRVAIGRALLSQPRLLLMDEPLSALDRATKEEILPFLERLQPRFALPVIYVTHDMAEVERLADHLVLMAAGRVIAAGALADLQRDPLLPLARARDAAVSLDGLVRAYDPQHGLATVAVDGAIFLVPSAPLAVNERYRLRIFAGDVSLALDPPSRSTIVNILPAIIVSGTVLDEHEIIVVLALGAGSARLLARVTRRSWEMLEMREGVEVFAQVKAVALVQAAQHARA